MGADEANIQASLCAAIRIAKERNSVSLEKRAEAPASVSSVRQLLSWSRSNHTVYGDLESRWFTAVISNRLIAQTRYQHGTPQDTSDRNFVPKRDLTR
jgi:hypothetical protein